MALTAETIRTLESKSFNHLFDHHEEKWRTKARSAEAYVRTWLPGGQNPYAADIANMMKPAIAIDRDFRQHCEQRKVRGNRWVSDFADYIVDKVYPTPIEGEAPRP